MFATEVITKTSIDFLINLCYNVHMYSKFNQSPHPEDAPDQSTGEQVDADLEARFQNDLESYRHTCARLEQSCIDEALEADDPRLHDYAYKGNTTTNPAKTMFSLGQDILRTMRYDIVFTTPAFDIVGKEIASGHMGVYAATKHAQAAKVLLRQLQPWSPRLPGSDPPLRPVQGIVCEALEGRLDSRWFRQDGHMATLEKTFGQEFVARARLLSALVSGDRSQSIGLDKARALGSYTEIHQQFPEITPLGIEECAGMVASVFHAFLAEHPEFHPKNLQ